MNEFRGCVEDGVGKLGGIWSSLVHGTGDSVLPWRDWMLEDVCVFSLQRVWFLWFSNPLFGASSWGGVGRRLYHIHVGPQARIVTQLHVAWLVFSHLLVSSIAYV